MLDGKVICCYMDVGAASCHICGATPTQMEDVDACLKRPIHPRAKDFGLSALHLWMRVCEFFLHIAYRLKVKKARIGKNTPESDIEKQEKYRLQQEFFDKMGGLRVDFPNPHGGTSNDGPTCRRMFREYKVCGWTMLH